jgi:hypothetical protein
MAAQTCVDRIIPIYIHDREQAIFEAACAGKDAYESESAADAVLSLMKRGSIRHRRSGGRWDTLNSYKCCFCGNWHLGHP